MPPFLKKLVLFAAFLVFFVVVSTKVRTSGLINLQSCCTNLFTGNRTNCIFIAVFGAAFYTLSYPTQTTSPTLHSNSKLSVEAILKCLTNKLSRQQPVHMLLIHVFRTFWLSTICLVTCFQTRRTVCLTSNALVGTWFLACSSV